MWNRMAVKGDFDFYFNCLFLLIEMASILLLIKINKNKNNHDYKKENAQEGIFRKLDSFSPKKVLFHILAKKRDSYSKNCLGPAVAFASHGCLTE